MKLPILALLLVVLGAGCALFNHSERFYIAPPGVVCRIPNTFSVDVPAGMDVDTMWARAAEGARTYWRNVEKIEISEDKSMMTIFFRNRKHFLKICYRLEGTQLIPDVPYSENLEQSGSKIHRNVPRWINNISVRIRASLNGIK